LVIQHDKEENRARNMDKRVSSVYPVQEEWTSEEELLDWKLPEYA
jgi:hypothetical protein